MKILVATGGTGGHIYPALVTAQELRQRGCEVTFIGTFGPSAEKIRAAGFTCVDIVAQGFVSRGLLNKIIAAWSMAKAFVRCIGIVLRLRPDAVLGFGGYSSFPTVMASVIFGVPAMVHEQNAMPGEANKLLSRFVRRVAVGFKDAMGFFPSGKAVWTGNPLRPLNIGITREQACARLGLDPARQTVLVFGGSQGSRALNRHVADAFADVPPGVKVQVIHISGHKDLDEVRGRYQSLGVQALVKAYMDDMALVYAASDVVIGRAGAGTVTELGLLGIPSVLIPYPGAKDHQKFNARVLERRGVASIIEEKCLRQDILRDKIFLQLKQGYASSLQVEIREKLQGDFASDGAKRLSDELLRLVQEKPGK